ncbi:hypothetical protein UlMin_029366 [Ulmus minor]
MAESVDYMLVQMQKAKELGADLVELRLDFLKSFSPKFDLEILVNFLLCLLLSLTGSNQTIWEGGQYKGDESKRIDALCVAMEVGADFIDIELQVAHEFYDFIQGKKLEKTKIIVSSHNYQMTPSVEEIRDLVARIQATGADIVKIATTALDITDSAHVFQVLVYDLYVMGEKGLISRILCAKFGGFLTFSLLELLFTVFGLISKPVGHSKGPLLHNPSLRYTNFNGIYVPMLVDDLSKFFDVYSGPDFCGFSVGIPYKEAVTEFCNEVHPLAKAAITAIEDTLIKGSIKREAYLNSPLHGKMFVLVGAGGEGRTLAIGAKSRGAHIVVFDIDFDRAKYLARAVDGEVHDFKDLGNFHPKKGAILANATPLGMHPNTNRIPVPEATLGDYELVFDSVYNPRKTRLLKEAEAAGAIIVSGVMFLRQAIGQINLFTAGQAPKELMRDIIINKF